MKLSSWILATSLGWIHGIAMLMIISGGLEPLGLSNTAIGLGMSLGIATIQWWRLRKHLEHANKWWWCGPVAFTVPFLIVDLMKFAVSMTTEIAVVTGTVLGAMAMAWNQHHFVLKSKGIGILPWIAINLLAYLLAIVPPFTLTVVRINELQLPGIISIVLSFASVLAGGPIIGWLTGRVLVGMPGGGTS